jgi:Co/Zn/Cd efflux system component
MADSCCDHCHEPNQGGPARRVLWIALVLNAGMFAVEIGAGLAAGSASLQADALDFLGDAANYSVSLFVVGMALRYRAMAALVKGASMGVLGLWVIAVTVWHAWHGTLPEAATMGAVGIAALVANGISFSLLYGHTVEPMPTCALRGYAPATTCSATWPSYAPLLV